MRLRSFAIALLLVTSLVVGPGCGPSYMSERSASEIEEDENYEDKLNPEGFEDADDENMDDEEGE